jgi:sugar lactone lactonase YvrE
VKPDGTIIFINGNCVCQLNDDDSITTITEDGIFNNPNGLAIMPDGETISVADTGNHRICSISPREAREVTTIAGNRWVNYGFNDGRERYKEIYYIDKNFI